MNDNIFIVYNAAGASDFHSHIVAAIKDGGKLPEELADLITLTQIQVNGKLRWRVDFA